MEKYIIVAPEGEIEFETIEEAMKYADETAAYTQNNITIHKGEITGWESAYIERIWHEHSNPKEFRKKDIIDFGSFGFYSEWKKFENGDYVSYKK